MMEEFARRYLQSNSIGRGDGGLKATMHQNLCHTFTMEHFSISNSYARRLTIDDKFVISEVRKSTLELTDYLDEVIGFPLDKPPNYKKMVPLFLKKFRELATSYIEDQPSLMTYEETDNLLKETTQYPAANQIEALEPYGFKFVDGDIESGVLTMISHMGVISVFTPNKFFGCSYELTDSKGSTLSNI